LFLRTSSSQNVLVVLNFSEKQQELDFSRTKELKDRSLKVLFSSAVRSSTDLSPRNLHIAAFEVFIAEVK